jgi:hypothetical protein
MVAKAAPMMIPTAMSSTLPRMANSLKSFIMMTPPGYGCIFVLQSALGIRKFWTSPLFMERS